MTIKSIKRERKKRSDLTLRRKEKNELKKTKQLLNDNIFHKTEKIVRDYLNEIETIALENNQLTNELKEWLNWANTKTDWFDPTTENEYSFLNNSDKKTNFN
jgi:hypothetical protein